MNFLNSFCFKLRTFINQISQTLEIKTLIINHTNNAICRWTDNAGAKFASPPSDSVEKEDGKDHYWYTTTRQKNGTNKQSFSHRR